VHLVCVFVQVLKKISLYIQEQNEKVYAPRGLLITDPIERGMRVVSLQCVCVCVCVCACVRQTLMPLSMGSV